MLAKIWKKVCLAILIIACLFNIMFKLVNKAKISLNDELVSSAQYMYEEYKYEQEENVIK